LPSITGLAARGADIAQAEHGGAVGDHRDQIAAGGDSGHLAGVFDDDFARGGHPRRIGERQIALVGERLGWRDLDLAVGEHAVVAQGAFIEIIGHVVGILEVRAKTSTGG
jgi:hypothetical protein